MLELNDASFQYRPGRGLLGATLRVEPGEIVGVVGGNGAGKSTLLGLIAAALVPQTGSVTLALADRAGRMRRYVSDTGIGYRRHVGYLTELAPVYGELTVAGYLKLRAKLRGERFLRIRRRVSEAMARCGLQSLRREPVGRLSLGLRRRVALAEAMLTLPAVLVLDDPFAGIDASLRATLADAIGEVSTRAHVVVSGHDPALLSACCRRFVLVERGRVVADALSAAEALAALAPPSPSSGGPSP